MRDMVVWLTGLPGAGKTTLATAVFRRRETLGRAEPDGHAWYGKMASALMVLVGYGITNGNASDGRWSKFDRHAHRPDQRER